MNSLWQLQLLQSQFLSVLLFLRLIWIQMDACLSSHISQYLSEIDTKIVFPYAYRTTKKKMSLIKWWLVNFGRLKATNKMSMCVRKGKINEELYTRCEIHLACCLGFEGEKYEAENNFLIYYILHLCNII